MSPSYGPLRRLRRLPVRVRAAGCALALGAAVTTAGAATVVYIGNADSQDLSVFALAADGSLTTRDTVVLQRPAEPGRSMLMAISPARKFLYAAYVSGGSHSTAAAFSIDPATGGLTLIGSTALADIMSYVSTDRTGRYLLSASYGGNKVTVNSVAADGTVGEMLQLIATEPKAHCIVTDPGNRYVLHTALGGDVIYQQKFDAKTGRLAPNDPPTMAVAPKAGPRFLTFSRDGRFVYVIHELNGSIAVFPFNSRTGTLGKALQVTTALPPGFSGQAWAADIHLTPNGRYLYASERTTSTLAAFSVDAKQGTLTSIASYPTVKQPRAFNIDPSGRYLLSTGQLSNSVMAHAIDPVSGQLTALKEYPVGANPTWVEIVQLP